MSLRILFVTPYVPSLLRIRPYGFLTQLARRGHRITLLSVATSVHDIEAVAALKPLCERIEVVRVSRVQALSNCLGGIASGSPLQALYCYSPAVRQRLATLLATSRSNGPRHATADIGPFDLAHVEHLRAALLGLEAHGLPRVYDSVDCISELFEITRRHGATWLSRFIASIDLPRTRRFEAQLTRRFERTVAASAAEAAALTRLHDGTPALGNKIHVVPNGVDLDYFSPTDDARDPATLLFVGRMSYHANVTAALDLVNAIMPTVWAARPDVRVVICGADPAPAVRRLAQIHGPKVEVTGTVADVRPYLRRATISVSPLRYAAGIQNKILEAMATATPVVAAPAGCSGLAVAGGADLLVGAQPDQFAAAITHLLADPALRRQIGAAGRRYVEIHHTWENMAKLLEATYQDAISTFRCELAATD